MDLADKMIVNIATLTQQRASHSRGWRKYLCVLGVHDYGHVWDVRPWTETNSSGLDVQECWRCGRLERIGY